MPVICSDRVTGQFDIFYHIFMIVETMQQQQKQFNIIGELLGTNWFCHIFDLQSAVTTAQAPFLFGCHAPLRTVAK
jgi:hypothetical protein